MTTDLARLFKQRNDIREAEGQRYEKYSFNAGKYKVQDVSDCPSNNTLEGETRFSTFLKDRDEVV
jgi:hypothetical protein